MPIRSGRSVQLISFTIQFARHTTSFRVLLVMTKIARCEKPSGDPTIDGSLQPSIAAVRQDLALDLTDQLGDVVVEVEVMAGEDLHAELRRRALRPGRYLVVGGDFVVVAQEGEDRA